MVALKAVGLDDKLFVHKSVKFHVVDDPLVVATAAFVKLGVLAYVLWAMFDPAQRQYFAFEVPGGSTAMWEENGGFPCCGIGTEMPAGLCDADPRYDVMYSPTYTYFDNTCREYNYGRSLCCLMVSSSVLQSTAADRARDTLRAPGFVIPVRN